MEVYCTILDVEDASDILFGGGSTLVRKLLRIEKNLTIEEVIMFPQLTVNGNEVEGKYQFCVYTNYKSSRRKIENWNKYVERVAAHSMIME